MPAGPIAERIDLVGDTSQRQASETVGVLLDPFLL